MPRIHIASALLILALASAGCASNHETSRVASSGFLANGAVAHNDDQKVSSNLGQSAMAWGDKHTATNLFSRAEKADSTPLNRFNLASAYQQVGRSGDALELYASVVKDGQGVTGKSLNPAKNRNARTLTVNLAEESQRRIDVVIEAAARGGPTASTGEDNAPLPTNLAAAALDATENPL